MKKLLSLLGAVTVSASTATAVVACSVNNPTTPEDDTTNPDLETSYAQDSMSKLMSQYAKTLYLNQNGLESNSEYHYSSDALMKSNVIEARVSTLGLSDFDSEEGVTNSTKFSDIAKKYFNTESLLATDVTLSDNIYQGTVFDPNAESDLTAALKGTVPLVLDFLTNPSTLITFLPMVSEILTPEILVTLKDVLTQENLKLIESAFSDEIYSGMNYQTSLDSSVIGLSNAIDKLFNGDSYTKLEYSTSELVEANIATANETLATNVYALINGEKTLDIDLLSNIDSLAEIIRFVRTLLVYIDQFTLEEMTASVLTLEQIEAKRAATFDASKNSVDIKLAFQKMSAMIDDENGIVFKNYIGILLATNSTKYSIFPPTDFKENVNDGLMTLVSEIAQLAIGEKLSVYYTNTLLRSLINGGLKSSYGGILFPTAMGVIVGSPDILGSPIQEFVQKIKDNGDGDAFKSDWMGYLWNNSNDLLGFNIKDLLTTPVDEIDLSGILGSSSTEEETTTTTSFSSTYGLNSSTVDLSQYYLNGKSIKDIVDQFNTAFSGITGVSSINFSDIADLAKILHTDNLIGKALEDPAKMMTVLGLGADGKIEDDTALAKLFDILEDFKEIAAKSNEVITVWNNESNSQINAIKTEAVNVFKKLTVTTEIVADNEFKYVVTNGNITNTFTIKLKAVDGKFSISSISLA